MKKRLIIKIERRPVQMNHLTIYFIALSRFYFEFFVIIPRHPFAIYILPGVNFDREESTLNIGFMVGSIHIGGVAAIQAYERWRSE